MTLYIYHLEVWRLPRCPYKSVYFIYLDSSEPYFATLLLKDLFQKPLRLTHFRVKLGIVYRSLRTIVVEFPFQNGAVSQVLEKVNLTTLGNANCSRQLQQDIQLHQFCAANGQGNACFVSINFYTRLINIYYTLQALN